MSVTQERAGVGGRLITGWGRTAPSRAKVVGPMPVGQLQELIAAAPAQGVLARGAGRSYGDAGLNAGGYVLDPATEPRIDLDPAAATVRAAGSTTFTQLLARIIPHGLVPAVVPGTGHATIGGAVATDVHGKNQRSDGSAGRWIEEIELLDGTGEVRRLTPGGDREAFRATVGGMGLTGIILSVKMRLLRVRSGLMQVATRRLADLDALLGAMDEAGDHYCAAWVDTTATGRSLGRGILAVADHLAEPDPAESDGLTYRPARAHRAPHLPICPFTSWSAREFNGWHFHKTAQEDSGITDLATFFHRLDTIEGWNRAVGPHGFVRYQLAVPEGGAHPVIADVLQAMHRHRCAPFAGTIQRFGAASASHLSFPLPGWSLAVDMPAGNRRLGPLLDELDERVAAEGGRVSLAEDSRLSASALAAMYPQLPQWRAARSRLDPAGVFRSDLGRRLGLC
jgi:decaprenylphospho-beta-D-ribofuranose 2-oxidase